MQQTALHLSRSGGRLGLVPTMGYLHAGHLSLIKTARQHSDIVALSLFVNPTQFGPNEDFSRYPRNLERDTELCVESGVDILFAPETKAMYAPDASVAVVEERLGRGLCGISRPTHFRGVTTVVAKLFNICLPDVAVFGEKDAQQLRVIKRMVRDLNFPVHIVSAPTVREADGLAMSSRNVLLTAEERQQAACLRKSLDRAEELFRAGERNVFTIRAEMLKVLEGAPAGKVDYLEFVDDETLQPVFTLAQPTLVAMAYKFSKTRLIDNTVLKADAPAAVKP